MKNARAGPWLIRSPRTLKKSMGWDFGLVATAPSRRYGRPVRWLLRLGVIAIAVGGVAGAWWYSGRPSARLHAPSHVGALVCAQCHAREHERWRGSHHDLAMQPATDASVAADFNDQRFSYAGVSSTFSRRDGKFMVRTDGPDGRLQDYEIKYTFGTSPLQQYLVEFPDGRLQALSIAWDTRPKAHGGQRWFHLYPGQNVTHRDELHWTARSQNWNYMCAECHSTGVRKNYDATARRFATRYAEVNVACEACHGPGSHHVAWARKEDDWWRLDGGTKGLAIALDQRKTGTWAISAETGNAQRTSSRPTSREVETCGRCHARRSQFSDDAASGRPLGDTYRVSLVDGSLYHVDGQIREEVYEYGSFLQSKMFARGVTCSDCHEPHSGKLRVSGGQVCVGCHAAQKYETATHHFHQTGSRGAECVGCHMPTTTYMVVDQRHDHSIRVPRPDLSVKLGVPNACTGCHTGRPAAWAARQVETWYGHAPRGYQRFAEALAAASRDAPDAAEQLQSIAADGDQPAFVRASALARLAGSATDASLGALRVGLKDPDALVRRAAVRALAGIEPGARVVLLAPLLDDPVRAVRIEAALALAGTPRDRLTTDQQAALARGRDEYVASEQFNADRPESHVNLALLYVAERRVADAEAELRAALEFDPLFVPAAINLADLYRASRRDAEGERVLRAALEHDPRSAAAHHAQGLLLARQQRGREALAELEAAARLAPESARYGYVYAVALYDAGDRAQAVGVLSRVLARHPYARDALTALVAYTDAAGNAPEALMYARRLATLDPSNAELARIVQRLEEQVHARRP
jgi:predicted CXXCH cytochrome family protein